MTIRMSQLKKAQIDLADAAKDGARYAQFLPPRSSRGRTFEKLIEKTDALIRAAMEAETAAVVAQEAVRDSLESADSKFLEILDAMKSRPWKSPETDALSGRSEPAI